MNLVVPVVSSLIIQVSELCWKSSTGGSKGTSSSYSVRYSTEQMSGTFSPYKHTHPKQFEGSESLQRQFHLWTRGLNSGTLYVNNNNSAIPGTSIITRWAKLNIVNSKFKLWGLI